MKIIFNNLESIKKEAVKLRNTIKKISTIDIGIQKSQDIIARMYGWQHYNEMSAAHQNIQKIDIKSEYQTLLKNDFHFINTIDTLNKDRLELQKRSTFLKAIKLIDENPENQSQLSIEFFKKKKAFLDGIFKPKDNNINIYDIPYNQWMLGTLILNQHEESLYKIYSTVPTMNAIENGGIFFLRDKFAFDIIKNIADSLPSEQQNRLKVVDLNSSFKTSPYSRSIDIKKDETTHSVFEFIMSRMTNRYPSGSDGLWTGLAAALLRTYSSVLKFKYGNKKGSLNNVRLSTELSVDNILNYIFKEMPDCPERRSAIKEFSTIYQLNEFDYKKEQYYPQEFLEQISYRTMQFSSILSEIDFYHNNKVPSIRIEDSLNSNDIVFFVFNEKYQKNHEKLQGLLHLLRNSITPLFNTEKKGTLSSNSTFKPIVLDASENYFLNGIAINSAQLRAIGAGFIFQFNCHELAKRNNPYEYASIVANTRNKFFIKFDNVNPYQTIAKSGIVDGSDLIEKIEIKNEDRLIYINDKNRFMEKDYTAQKLLIVK